MKQLDFSMKSGWYLETPFFFETKNRVATSSYINRESHGQGLNPLNK